MQELDDVRWRAVEGRDATMSGCFVYAVASTKVFCRPNCGSRRALRRNVEFFATVGRRRCERATAPCRRCHPEELGESDPTVAAVVETCRRLERASDSSLAEIASELGFSERHLRRRFHDIIGVSAGVYARAYKAERVKESLRGGEPVTNAVFDAGYGSVRAFYEHGAPTLGMTPATVSRRAGVAKTFRFTTVETTLGWVVAARHLARRVFDS